MQLYAGSTTDFIADSVQHRVAEKLGDAFYEYFRFRASASEFSAWQNSLTALTSHIQYSRLLDNGIVLELQLPLSSSRLDAMLTGRDDAGRERAVIVELKQWTKAVPADVDDCVMTFLGHRERTVPHPSIQAANYRRYLADMNSAFYAEPGPVELDGCAWLHNLDDSSRTALTGTPFAGALAAAPLFTGHDAVPFRDYLQERLSAGGGMPVLDKIVHGGFAPSKKLLEHASRMIAGEPAYTLLDDQIVAYETILTLARRGLRTKSDHAVVVVRGGPGTGKSVIALNVMATLLAEGRNVQHATGSKAFTESLRKRLGPRARALLQYFNSFGGADAGAIDVLVCDEAHRIRTSSSSRFTPKARRTDRAQVEELIDASRLAVFFIDDHQAVRPAEVGSTTLIREAAVRLGARYRETELSTQFRCAGSDEYVDWIDQLLEVRKTGRFELGEHAGFEFRIFDTPAELDAAIRAKARGGYAARMTAGFCWRWSDPRPDGTLVDDVEVGAFRRPWNAKPDAARLARGIPKASFWASDPGGLDQVGCVYTAQGFEFDYAGVIFGRDLRWDPESREWIGDKSVSHDSVVKRAGARFTDCVKNTYRVLLTRGMRGCYVTFLDDATRELFASRARTP